MAEAVPVFVGPVPRVRRIEMDQPWQWLIKGWQDFRKRPTVALTYGVLAAVSGYLVTLGLWWTDMFYLVLPLTAGFLIIGPILAVGLYEVSLRNESGLPSGIAEALAAFRKNGSQIALMGVALMLLMFLWARVAAILFFLYYGVDPPSVENLFVDTFLDADSWPFLIIGCAVGGILAIIAFSISVVAIPLLLDRTETNVIEAIATSVRVVQVNPGPLLFWAILIAIFTIAGLVTLYIGLVVTLPLIGHASWHAYRDLVAFDGDAV